MNSSNAAKVQGAGPDTRDGNPIDVNVLSSPALPNPLPVTVTNNVTVNGTVAVSNFPATQPVSGAVTANQGTSPWIVQENPLVVSGTINGNGQTVTLTNPGHITTVVVDIPSTGALLATLALEYSGDGGVNWQALQPLNILSLRRFSVPFATAGLLPASLAFSVMGLSLRVRSTAYTSGSALITLSGSFGAFPPEEIRDIGTYTGTGALTDADGVSNSLLVASDVSLNSVRYLTYNHLFNGSTWDRERTANVFKTAATAAAGNTALWTPAGGKRFRLMRYMITVTDNATLAGPGVLTISLFDAAAGVTAQVHDLFVPAVALNNSGVLYSSGWIILDNGFRSAANNNVLNVNLSAALVTGTVRVICCGDEE